MATLETQYKLFTEKNPHYSHWTYKQWLDWWSYSVKEAIEEGFEPTVSDDFQIGPDGAFEHTDDFSEIQIRYKDIDCDTGLITEDNLISVCYTEQSAKWVLFALDELEKESTNPNRTIYTIPRI